MSKTLQKTDLPLPATVVDPVDDFLRAIKAGIECWRQAGEILCRLVEDDPAVFNKITQRVPWLNHEILSAFQRIGQRQLCPYLLLDGSAASKRLAYLPYDQQVAIYNTKKVQIAYETLDGSYAVKDVSWHFLTRSEAELAFDDNGLRSFDDQVVYLKRTRRNGTHRRRHNIKTTGRCNENVDQEAEVIDEETEDLDEKPIVSLKKHLEHSQAALIAARADLMMIGKPIHKNQDTWIEIALKAIGEFRFTINESE